MGLNHDHNHSHTHKGTNSRNILIAFFLNLSFSIIEFIGGALTNSVAIMSDAVHDLGDSISLLLSYYAEKNSTRAANDRYPYGYRRYSILGALLNAIILITGSAYVIYEACQRLYSQEPVDPDGMLYLALLGIVVNSISAYVVSKGSGLNQKMVMYHLLEDLMGWVAVLVISIILMYKPWYFLDSVLSILISIIILRGVIKSLIKIIDVILQKFPSTINRDVLIKDLNNIEGIETVFDLKAWSIDGEHHYADIILTGKDSSRQNVIEILGKFNIINQTLVINLENDN